MIKISDKFQKLKIIAQKNKSNIAIIFLVIIAVLSVVDIINTPVSYSKLAHKAEKLVKEEKIAFALQEYNQLVRRFPDNYDAHKRLGDLYLKVDEVKMAKIEYLRALKIDNKNRYEANAALADLYAKEGNYIFAEELILELKDSRNKSAIEAIGDFYYKWGWDLKNKNNPESIRKLRIAHNYYKIADSKKISKVEEFITVVYADMADKLIKSNKLDEAVEIINLSLKFSDNALSYYKLAEIYERQKNIDASIKNYSKAFKINPNIGSKKPYIKLMMEKAKILEKNNDKVSAELYYTKVKKLDSEVEIPMNPDKKILFNLLSTKVSENIDNDEIFPGIAFKLLNLNKEPISYAKVKVKFFINEKLHNERVVEIAGKDFPINSSSESKIISVFSEKPVKHVFDNHNIRVQVFISQKNPDEWKLYRNITIARKRDSSIIIPQ